jgi:hypothetical protein
MNKKFELGDLVVTRGVYEQMKADKMFNNFVTLSLGRYVNCDWGKTCKEDAKLNDEAVENNDGRILAVYICKKTNTKIWIITEADRSVTTVLFPEEY